MPGSRRAVVTGCAGFIGSWVAEALVAEGFRVLGIDAFKGGRRPEKEANLGALAREPRFRLLEDDLLTTDLGRAFRGHPVVIHLAGQPGVRASFGAGFAGCAADNLGATQAVLEAARATGARRVVWASSSSVYGDAAERPCREGAPTRPRSPYGVTKLACEGLAAIARSGGLSVTGLRYFTVYGPRQRPDMALRRMCEALAGGPAFPLLGDGGQSRDVTHVTDAAEATVRAAMAAEVADVYNVGGGQEASLAELMAELAALAGHPVPVLRRDPAPGDVRHTAADTTRARRDLGWRPRVGLREGLAGELAWVRARASRFDQVRLIAAEPAPPPEREAALRR
ncbi:MAG: UDP-glucuronate 4-epimerase [Miltoncostaeaceae bacterium]|nr:UDP-glucuronate 4-epimerase [Miltoncostaeaceae bacterium]